MSRDDPQTLALDLLRRLPPSKINENLDVLISLCPSIAEDLISSVDQPLQIRIDSNSQNQEYLCCDYNRDGDSYRSPWSSNYDPPLEDGTQPPKKLRELEIRSNEAFNTFRQLYYDGGLSSVYLWELEGSGFAGVVLFKKSIDGGGDSNQTIGNWDSLHVFEVLEKGRMATYELTSTIMLSLSKKSENNEKQSASASSSSLQLAGSLTRQIKSEFSIKDGQNSHISNMGKMIEEMESKIRNQLQEVYFGKTKDIIASLRSTESLQKLNQQRELQKELMGVWKK